MGTGRGWSTGPTGLFIALAVSVPVTAVGVYLYGRERDEREDRERVRACEERAQRQREDEYDRAKHPEKYCDDDERIEMLAPEGGAYMMCPAQVTAAEHAGFVVRFPRKLAIDAGLDAPAASRWHCDTHGLRVCSRALDVCAYAAGAAAAHKVGRERPPAGATTGQVCAEQAQAFCWGDPDGLCFATRAACLGDDGRGTCVPVP